MKKPHLNKGEKRIVLNKDEYKSYNKCEVDYDFKQILEALKEGKIIQQFGGKVFVLTKPQEDGRNTL